MTNKKLCIIWKWDELSSSKQIYQLVQIEDSNDQILQIHESKLDHVHEWIDEFCNAVLTSSQAEFIVLYHDKFKDRIPKIELFIQKCKETCNTILFNFGYGNNFIYYHDERKTGLLNQTGGFQNGYRLGVKEKVTVLNGDKVLFASFDAVWNHYSLNKYKAPIYTYLREKLLLTMFGTEFNQTLRSWLEQIPTDAKEVINEFVEGNHPVFQKNNAAASSDHQELLFARNNLIQLMDKPSPSATEIRSVTEALLQNIAGPIY